MSAADNEWGLSLPTNIQEDSMSPIPDDFWKVEFASNLSDSAQSNALSDIYMPSDISGLSEPKATSKSISGINTILGDYLGSQKAKAQKEMFYGAGLKTAAAAGELFSNLLTYGYTRTNANLQASNTKQSMANQMLALDNQVQYYKNQITDKFAQTMARNTVTMAAKNLRVTASNLLEQTKDAAYDATKDIQMLESNAELKKIALRSAAKQADVTKKLTNNLATANLIGSLAKVGLAVSTGGGTMMSWGDLYAGYNQAKDYEAISKASQSGSLNDLY